MLMRFLKQAGCSFISRDGKFGLSRIFNFLTAFFIGASFSICGPAFALLPDTPLNDKALVDTFLFIVSGVQDFCLLAEDGVNDNVKIKIRDANKDGIQQIVETLSSYRDLKSIQIVSHGNMAQFYLGGKTLHGGNMGRYSAQLKKWGESLSESGDILIFGCNVGEGAAGRDFISRLSLLTGADVASSDDLTGPAIKGGDWDL